jgi:hypothetical protein
MTASIYATHCKSSSCQCDTYPVEVDRDGGDALLESDPKIFQITVAAKFSTGLERQLEQNIISILGAIGESESA